MRKILLRQFSFPLLTLFFFLFPISFRFYFFLLLFFHYFIVFLSFLFFNFFLRFSFFPCFPFLYLFTNLIYSTSPFRYFSFLLSLSVLFFFSVFVHYFVTPNHPPFLYLSFFFFFPVLLFFSVSVYYSDSLQLLSSVAFFLPFLACLAFIQCICFLFWFTSHSVFCCFLSSIYCLSSFYFLYLFPVLILILISILFPLFLHVFNLPYRGHNSFTSNFLQTKINPHANGKCIRVQQYREKNFSNPGHNRLQLGSNPYQFR